MDKWRRKKRVRDKETEQYSIWYQSVSIMVISRRGKRTRSPPEAHSKTYIDTNIQANEIAEKFNSEDFYRMIFCRNNSAYFIIDLVSSSQRAFCSLFRFQFLQPTKSISKRIKIKRKRKTSTMAVQSQPPPKKPTNQSDKKKLSLHGRLLFSFLYQWQLFCGIWLETNHFLNK